ncbi:hypothetical protein DUNSADRAFT_3063 [Dunaliella salina]|uniref:Uncharacterized protein n=1 Tax=Dunaliella salina TaxID=3046 RepID=A0ABQ7FVZ6_DUNSA|nr:hypothetical protein DUNSADRAFT_3063 [Dunaliella salina]|eukprot:KAF5826451.1 hypothetical protein DUNSADRAFT_3063 [Dunaliella salina]
MHMVCAICQAYTMQFEWDDCCALRVSALMPITRMGSSYCKPSTHMLERGGSPLVGRVFWSPFAPFWWRTCNIFASLCAVLGVHVTFLISFHIHFVE